MTYFILHKDGLLVGVHPNNSVHQLGIPGVSIDEYAGDTPDLNKVVWDGTELKLISSATKLSKLEFMSRFTQPERFAAQTSLDPILVDALSLLQMAEFIDITDQRTINMVGYMGMLGIILPERIAEILS